MTSEQFNRPGAVDLSHLSQSAGAAADGNYVMAITEAEFEQVAAQSTQHPVVLEFYSPRDPNGEAVSKALANAVNAEAGRFLLGRINVDEQPRIAQALGVQAVPTVVALIAGQMAPLFQGTKSAEEIKAVLEQVAQAAVANGMTGRAEPVGGGASSGVEEAQAANPKFAAADAALEAGDYAKAVEEFDKLLQNTPNDVEVIAGRAQASLLERSTHFDPAQVVANAGNSDDLQAQLEAADLEVIQGANEQALERLLDFAATASPEEKEEVRVRVLELFEVIGRTDPVVLKARRRLATVLF
ncbi:tetratricopeptide repeat protein [uncultured Tessaracoccus sp.]|uniref:tetratricopeptide repeat protein n=1 Tax=uncultured Tessaracoccus sp. TaxID=905023 RepID=UPI00261D5D1E|nr:tetratricopeptide repeat protein [uncultured Tessaracoccus sp.]